MCSSVYKEYVVTEIGFGAVNCVRCPDFVSELEGFLANYIIVPEIAAKLLVC